MARVLAALAVCGLVSGAAAGIYPSDHWSYVTKLTNDAEFDLKVEEAVNSEQTLFVRWIASEG